MDKIVLEQTLNNKTIKYKGNDIEIEPFISLAHQAVLIEQYIKDYFGTPEEIMIDGVKHHYLEAECRLKGYILKLFTNIDVDKSGNDLYVDPGLWVDVTDNIMNYSLFRKTLEHIVDDAKIDENLKYSIGKVVSDLIEKANNFIDKMDAMNVEELKAAGEKGIELIERLEKTSVLKNPADAAEIINPVDSAVKKVASEIRKGNPKSKRS